MKITLIHKALTIIGLVVLIGAISSTEANAALEQQAYFNQSLSPVDSQTVSEEELLTSPRTEYEFRDVEPAPIPIPKQYMDDSGNITTLTPLN